MIIQPKICTVSINWCGWSAPIEYNGIFSFRFNTNTVNPVTKSEIKTKYMTINYESKINITKWFLYECRSRLRLNCQDFKISFYYKTAHEVCCSDSERIKKIILNFRCIFSFNFFFSNFGVRYFLFWVIVQKKSFFDQTNVKINDLVSHSRTILFYCLIDGLCQNIFICFS